MKYGVLSGIMHLSKMLDVPLKTIEGIELTRTPGTTSSMQCTVIQPFCLGYGGKITSSSGLNYRIANLT